MRIAVFGTGGVGGYFGGRLAQAGEDVTFIARGEHLRAIKTSGLKVDSRDSDFVVFPAKATDDVREVGEVDLVVVGVKAWQVPEAAREMKSLVGPTTTVLPLQNGVEAVPQLVNELGSDNVIGGLCRIVSFVVGPGHIRHAGFTPSIVIGELDNRRTDRIEKIENIFKRAGLETTVATDIQVALWMKFLFIASFSGVGAIANAPAGVIRSDPKWRAQIVRAMEEIYALAHARGILSWRQIQLKPRCPLSMPCLKTQRAQCSAISPLANRRSLSHRTEQWYVWDANPVLRFQHTNRSTRF